jgi:hypothetical protein
MSCSESGAGYETQSSVPKPTELQTPIPFPFNHLAKFQEAGSGITAAHKVTKMDTGKQEINYNAYIELKSFEHKTK